MEVLIALAAIVTLAVPGRSNANASMATDGDRVAIAWAASAPAGETDIYVATSGDSGRSFSAPVRANDVEGEARVSGEQPPRVAIRGAEVVVSWVSKRDGTTIRVARSIDGGRTFAVSRAVSKAGAPGNRGWHSMTLDAHGDIVIAWLDHRELASQPAHQMDASTHGTHDGAAMAEHSALYIARVSAGVVHPEQRVTTGVCYCCKTAVAAGRDGGVVTAWRHVYPGNIRDIAFSRAADGRTFSAPVRVSVDQWALDGCPEDGPSVAVDRQGTAHIVWPTATRNGAGSESAIALFYAASGDGKTFTAREPLPTAGVAHHPQIAVEPDGSIAATWEETRDGARHVTLARGVKDATGRVRFTREPIGQTEPGVYPVVGTTRDQLIVAWTGQAAGGPVIRVQGLGATGAATK